MSREMTQEKYGQGGRPSIDPVVFFKLQLVMFFEGIRSERLLMRHAADRRSRRWYLGYDLSEELPEHSSLTRIRTRDAHRDLSALLRGHCRAMSASSLILGERVVYR